MHKLRQLIRQVNKTHKRLGQMIAMNILVAKSKRCILNVAPAGCGKNSLLHLSVRDTMFSSGELTTPIPTYSSRIISSNRYDVYANEG